ncbi:uncharacterized protein LOC122014080 [Zingiber officinale]|uniref:uncharacterized protein LOC122014080 n=1 Tax=Zingiber officinale TaxID=94328 RepID=UPI001C4ACDCF|nr:uncharacterized protein LOC122014080 [Zingiber officinale]
MDFIIGLPRTIRGSNSIWVIVDHLTKSAHFLPVKTALPMTQYAELYIWEIVRLHGIPLSIVSDRDTRFTSTFCRSLHASLGTKLQFSTAFHPQTDGQTKRDEVGERAELGLEIVQQTEDIVRRIKDRMRTAQSRQKSYADLRRDLEFAVGDHVFVKVAPMKGVMRFGKKGKLAPRYIGSFEILNQVGTLAYLIALPPSLAVVHNVFHISMLWK